MAAGVGLKKIFTGAPYVEAMFQIWWRLVHKWRHSLVYSRRSPDTGNRTPETGHVKWFYILSNAAMQYIGQTINSVHGKIQLTLEMNSKGVMGFTHAEETCSRKLYVQENCT